MEICSEVLDKENKLEQFALTGKETFLAYITLFRSVQECKVYGNLVIPTLTNGKKLDGSYRWDQLAYLCGRYAQVVDLDFFDKINDSFIHGLKENRCAVKASTGHPYFFIHDQDLLSVIYSLPLKEITTDSKCMTRLNDHGCQLKVDKLEITDSYLPDIFYLQNFTASEIVLQESVSEHCMDEIKAARRENKLNPNLKDVKRWTNRFRGEDLFNHVLPSLSLFKTISPEVEQCTMKTDYYISSGNCKRHLRQHEERRRYTEYPLSYNDEYDCYIMGLSQEQIEDGFRPYYGSRKYCKYCERNITFGQWIKALLQRYCMRTNELISTIGEQWKDIPDLRLHVVIRIQIDINCIIFNNIYEIKGCFRNFLDYDITELPSEDKNIFMLSKRVYLTENFLIDGQIEMKCWENDPSRPGWNFLLI